VSDVPGARPHIIFAHPPFLTIERHPSGSGITVRMVDTIEPGIAHKATLPLGAFRQMIEACRDEELVQVIGALIHTGKA
jgi:hypothetical protein